MAFTEAQNAAIVRTELDDVFFQTFDNAEGGYSLATANTGSLFKQIPITEAAYIYEVNLGPGLFTKFGTNITPTAASSAPVGELSTIPSANLAVKNKVFVNAATFAQDVTLSKQLFDDNLHGVWENDVSQFAVMARQTQDNNAFGIFNGAFTTTLTADQDPYIGTHTLLNGGTTSNQVSGALSPTTLNAAYRALYVQVNQAGVPLGNQPHILLVAPVQLKLATEITDSVLVSDSGNNAVNFYRSALGITIMSSQWLDSSVGGNDTAWFVLAKTHAVRRIVRQGIETFLRYWGYSNNMSYNYQANFREEVSVFDYAGSVGSNGT